MKERRVGRVERAGIRTLVGRVDAMSKSLRARACSSNRTQSSVTSAACTASLLCGDDIATLAEELSASGSVDLLHLVYVVCVCEHEMFACQHLVQAIKHYAIK